jgi:hypothetical protein
MYVNLWQCFQAHVNNALLLVTSKCERNYNEIYFMYFKIGLVLFMKRLLYYIMEDIRYTILRQISS